MRVRNINSCGKIVHVQRTKKQCYMHFYKHLVYQAFIIPDWGFIQNDNVRLKGLKSKTITILNERVAEQRVSLVQNTYIMKSNAYPLL